MLSLIRVSSSHKNIVASLSRTHSIMFNQTCKRYQQRRKHYNECSVYISVEYIIFIDWRKYIRDQLRLLITTLHVSHSIESEACNISLICDWFTVQYCVAKRMYIFKCFIFFLPLPLQLGQFRVELLLQLSILLFRELIFIVQHQFSLLPRRYKSKTMLRGSRIL